MLGQTETGNNGRPKQHFGQVWVPRRMLGYMVYMDGWAITVVRTDTSVVQWHERVRFSPARPEDRLSTSKTTRMEQTYRIRRALT
jgi:hypothetical protein